MDLSPATRREEGEGWDREQAKRLEERNKWFEEGGPLSEMGSRWDSMELKKGSVPIPVLETMDFEVNRKWAEFENLSFEDMSVQSLIGAQAYEPSTPQGSLVTSQTYQSSPEEDKRFFTGSQTGISGSKEAPLSVNGAEMFQTNTVEALKKEVNKTFLGCFPLEGEACLNLSFPLLSYRRSLFKNRSRAASRRWTWTAPVAPRPLVGPD